MTPPRTLVVGTAGHVDHGKSRLVLALTGTDPDRLKEERERGITIDLGFAHWTSKDGTRFGFVDVPGHERFVRNMLAGVGGFDLVLFVVAADESIKPQTREHFDICRLLRISRGIVALTKVDLVEPDILELVKLEIVDFAKESFLASAPIVPVSSKTGQGIEALRERLCEMSRDVPVRPATGIPRLPIDRAFSIKGFGTVVTGTLVAGSLKEGQEVVILPSGMEARVRGLQSHNAPAQRVVAGQRVAVNLQGVDPGSITRGDLVTIPAVLESTHLLDVSLDYLSSAGKPLRDLSRVGLHMLTSETPARVKLVGAAPVMPGGTALAQLRTERPFVALPGDRFVLRRLSPPMTIGGGTILHNAPAKLRGHAPDTLIRYSSLSGTSPLARLQVFVDESRDAGIDAAGLRGRTGLTVEEINPMLEELARQGAIREIRATPSRFMSQAAWRSLQRALLALLEEFHRREPLREGVAREELKARVFGRSHAEVFRAMLQDCASTGRLRMERDWVALASHQVAPSVEQERMLGKLEALFVEAGANPPDRSEITKLVRIDARRVDELVHLLLARGRLVRIIDGKIFHAGVLEALKRKLWKRWREGPAIDISEFKEMAGTARKNAIPLLEHLDQARITRREGSVRIILPPPDGFDHGD